MLEGEDGEESGGADLTGVPAALAGLLMILMIII